MNFFVPGAPKGQPRVRAFTRGRHAGVYDPGTADDWKAAVHIATLQALARHGNPARPLFGAVRVDLEFVFARPKSHLRSNGDIKPTAPIWHTAKPDRDNLDKAVLDTLTKLQVWPDDSHVCQGSITKRYAASGEASGCMIKITPLD